MSRKYFMTVDATYTERPDGLWDAEARYRSRSISVYGHGTKKDAKKCLINMAEKLKWMIKN